MGSSIDATVFAGSIPVTKSDTVNDPNGPFAGLYIATAGNISWIDSQGNASGTTGAPLAVSAGHINVRVVRVNSTGTTAVVLGLKSTS